VENATQVTLEVKDLSVAYGKAVVLRQVNMQVPSKGITLLLGRNGAGKTTTLLAVAGLIPKRGGQVIFEGVDISAFSPLAIVQAGISNVLEGHRIFVDLTIKDNLRLGAFGLLSGKPLSDRVERVLELFPQIREFQNKKAGSLSGGQQQILAIGQGLVSSPKLLLLDEPSVGIAPRLVSDILGLIKSLRNEGMSVLLVEQLVQKAMDVADIVYLFDNQTIVGQGTPQELRGRGLVERVYLGREVNTPSGG
jgi:branched-chain amino acid transport system ATP-binding protein